MSRELKGGTRGLKQNIQIHARYAVRMVFCFMKSHVELVVQSGGGVGAFSRHKI